MPLRTEVLAKRWSTANLPILPFLAPRVFQPWPSPGGRRRRNHTSTEASQPKTKIVVPNYDTRPVPGRAGGDAALRSYVEDEERVARKPRDTSHKHSTWGMEPRNTQDEKPLSTGENGGVVWKPFGGNLVDELTHTSIDVSCQDRKRVPLKNGEESGKSLVEEEYREIVQPPTGARISDLSAKHGKEYSSTDTQDHQGILDNMQQETTTWEIADENGLLSWNLKSSRTDLTSVGELPTSATSPSSVEEVDAPDAHEKNSYLYWRNMFDSLKSSPKNESVKPFENHSQEQIPTYLHFPKKKVHHFWYQRGVKNLWEDFIRLDKTEFEILFNNLSERTQTRLWPGLMLIALRHRPSEALKLLEITYTVKQPPAYAISDSLDYLIPQYLPKQEEENVTWMDNAGNVDKALIAQELQQKVVYWLGLDGVRILQKSIWVLITNLNDENVYTFYEDLRRLNHHIFPNTLIHFASRFAKSKDASKVDLSFDIVNELPGKLDFDHPAVLSLCTTILHRSHQAPDTKSTVSEKFQVMIGHGLKVNIIIYNVLIHNAILSGDSETAWNIHEMMIENGLEPDEYTYSILLNDAKWRMDSPAIRSVMGYLKEKNIAGPYIATDLIHLIFLLHRNAEQTSEEDESEYIQRSRRKIGFEKMLGKYGEHFHLNPLAKYIPDFSRDFPQASNPEPSSLIDPPVPTLVVMLTGLLYSLDSVTTKKLYDRFIRLIDLQDPATVELANSSYIWNVFIMAHGRFHNLLNDCPKIIKTMIALRDEAKQKLPPYQRRALAFNQQIVAEPDIYTWSILLHIFTKHHQLRAAEKVLTAMQSRGMTPNEVTWTTLACAYSRMQDVEKMADTIHRMEREGVDVGERTVAAMAGINDRGALLRALKVRKAMEMDESAVDGHESLP